MLDAQPSFGVRARQTVTVSVFVPLGGLPLSVGSELQGTRQRTGVCFSAPVASVPVSKWLSVGRGEQKLSLAACGRLAPQQLSCSQIRGSRLGGWGLGS